MQPAVLAEVSQQPVIGSGIDPHGGVVARRHPVAPLPVGKETLHLCLRCDIEAPGVLGDSNAAGKAVLCSAPHIALSVSYAKVYPSGHSGGYAVAIVLYIVSGGVALRLGEVTEGACAGIETEVAIVHATQDVAVRAQGDVAKAIGGHSAAIAYGRLERTELIAVIAAETVPCGKPH